MNKQDFSNSKLLQMDIIHVYKLLLEGQIKKFPPGIWISPNAINNANRCCRYLLDEVLKWTQEDIKLKLNKSVFRKYKLSGMLQTVYNNSPYEVIMSLFPNQFKPWELSCVPNKVWEDKNNRILAMDWLINTKLKWTDNDIVNKYNSQVLIDNNLGGLLSISKGNAFLLLEEYAPNKFKESDFKDVNYYILYWKDKKNRIADIKNMIEDVLKWDETQVKQNLSIKTFKENNLDILLRYYYDNNPHNALQEAYPHKYLPWDLSSLPSCYWNEKKNRVKAVKWLFEIKLDWSIEDIKQKVNKSVFEDNGLATLLWKNKDGIYSVILEAYPYKIKKWELPFRNSLYWEDRNNRVKALNHLFNKTLKWSKEDIKNNISKKVFIDNGLRSLLTYYNESPYNAIKDYLPKENIKPWELQTVPKGYWTHEKNRMEFMNWMIDEFDINLDNIEKINKQFMLKNRLYGIVFSQYNSSTKRFKEDLVKVIE